MGAVETMEDFFDRLNTGDRAGAVKLFDERAEMRVHVQGSSRTLRGSEQVGGWFLRADKGLRMIPGEVRDTGNTYEVGPCRDPSGGPEPAPGRHVPGRGRAHHGHQPRATVVGAPVDLEGAQPGTPSRQRLVILAEGAFGDHSAKTAFGVLRYGSREVVAVIDSTRAPCGRR